MPTPQGASSLISPSYQQQHPPGGHQGNLPEDKYLIRTVVLSNMTVIHNGIEAFRQDMEDKLTRAYRHAYVVRRFKRQDLQDPLIQDVDDDEEELEDDDLDASNSTESKDYIAQEEAKEFTLMPNNSSVASSHNETEDSIDEIDNDEESSDESESGSPNIEEYDEDSLTQGNDTQTELLGNVLGREGRLSGDGWPVVKIHNIRSSLPEPEIEMIYTVSKGKIHSAT